MQTLAQIRAMLEERGLAPRKSLGQNFLIDQNLVQRLVDRAGVGPGDLVLEIGPGTGVLTEALLDAGATVIAGELDRGLAQLLRERLGDRPSFTLIEGDCLEGKRTLAPTLDRALAGRPFSLVANLPYGAATPLMLTLLTQYPGCRSMAVTIQKEVVDRLLAGPEDGKAYGQLSVIAWALAEVERIANLPPECFWPRPGVTSAMVLLTRRESSRTVLAPNALAELAYQVFENRRKQLGSSLKERLPEGFCWPEGIDPTDRAESLSPEAVIRLCEALARVDG